MCSLFGHLVCWRLSVLRELTRLDRLEIKYDSIIRLPTRTDLFCSDMNALNTTSDQYHYTRVASCKFCGM